MSYRGRKKDRTLGWNKKDSQKLSLLTSSTVWIAAVGPLDDLPHSLLPPSSFPPKLVQALPYSSQTHPTPPSY